MYRLRDGSEMKNTYDSGTTRALFLVLTSGGSSLPVTSAVEDLTPSFSPCRLPGPCMSPGAGLNWSSEGGRKETHRHRHRHGHRHEELAGDGGLDFPMESLSPWKLSVFIIYI